MMNLIKYTCVLCIATLVLSCSEVAFHGDIADTPQKNFDYLWDQVNRKYSFFQEKKAAFGLDWDDVKTTYSAKIKDNMTEEELFKILSDMILELKDGHSNLEATFNTVATNLYDKPQSPWGHSDGLDSRIILEYYLPKEYYNTGGSTFTHSRLKQDNSIAYVRYSSFNSKVTKDPTLMDFVLEKHSDAKALIFDIRENGGGDVRDMKQLVSRFLNTVETVGYVRDVNGPKRNDFTDFTAVKFNPYNGKRWPSSKSIILLTDRGTYSAGSFFTLFMKDLPNVTTVGDDTGGGLGLPNGGELPNGWIYRFSISQTADRDKANTSYENGVPVEVYAELDKTIPNKDEVIEKAIEIINNNN